MTVTIDGKKVASVENKDPRTFKDVSFFAGYKFHPAADASYRNLVWDWKNIGLSGDLKRNTEIGTIPSWGPQFRIHFDLKINSHVSGDRGGWSCVISFKKDGGKSNAGRYGDRSPSIYMNKKGFLVVASAVNGKRNHNFKFHSIKLNEWFSVTIEQTSDKGKVR